MRKQAIPLGLLLHCNEYGLFDTLRVWMRLKNLYTKQVFYNFSYASLSKKSGFSRTALKKHIPIMERLGLLTFSGNHLFLTGIDRLKSKYKKICVLVPICSNKRQQIAQLRHTIIRLNINNQKRQILIKKKLVSLKITGKGFISKSLYKKVKKGGGLAHYVKSLNTKTTLSNKRFGAIFNLSYYSGRKIQQMQKKLQLIETKPIYKLVKHNAKPIEKVMLGGKYRYEPNFGILLERTSNEIHIVADTKKS